MLAKCLIVLDAYFSVGPVFLLHKEIVKKVGFTFIFLISFFAVLGIALFASWPVLSNITSGIIIFFSFPYRIGHEIEIVGSDNHVGGEIMDMTLF